MPLEPTLHDLLERLARAGFSEPELRAEVDRLLRRDRDHHAEIEAWLRTLADPGAALASASSPEEIGPYTVLGVLGQGGMGTVYRAAQRAPVQREVALKLIKRGMDSEAIVRRFEIERQALALMQHDGIAKVYDCGTTEGGQPYFVMELVQGEPLTSYCERRHVGLRERIALAQEACAAVQHAHSKGIVHRDLKPSNVLVAESDGRPRVKIIDFGLAKAIVGDAGAATMLTEAGQVMGTPGYMAPEQAASDNADIDTRADVYSLGVILCEVLVGQLPYRWQDLRHQGVREMQRVIREADPPRPSVLFATSGDCGRLAARRGMSESALARVLRADLDWVVLRALEKDRERRYPSADALRADLQRFLDYEPVQAGPPGLGYRARKFLRKHRGSLILAGSIAVTAVAGVVLAAAARSRTAVIAAQLRTLQAEEQFPGVILGEWRDAGINGRRFEDGGKQQVIRELDALLDLAPNFELCRYYRFMLLRELGDPRTTNEVEQLGSGEPSEDLRRFFAARTLARQHEQAKALEMFKPLEQHRLLGANVLVYEATLLTTGGNRDWDRALVKLWQAEMLAPRNPAILYNLASFLLNRCKGDSREAAAVGGQLTELRERLDRAMEQSKDVRLLLARGWVALLSQPDGYLAARPFFEQAIALSPGDVAGYLNASRTYLDEARAVGDDARVETCLESARDLLERGRKAEPSDAEIEITSAMVFLGLNDRDRAREAALRAIELGGERLRSRVSAVLDATKR